MFLSILLSNTVRLQNMFCCLRRDHTHITSDVDAPRAATRLTPT